MRAISRLARAGTGELPVVLSNSSASSPHPCHARPMADAVTPLPSAKAFGEDERSVLLGYLAYHRAVLARKAEGLSDEQARRAACPPSSLTLLGLIRHMTDVERWWFRRVLLGQDIP